LRSFVRASAVVVATVLVLVTTQSMLVVAASAAGSSVSGGGSTFAAPEIQDFAAETGQQPYNLAVNYAVSGSGAGRDSYAQGAYQYGASDIVFNRDDGSLAQTAATDHPFDYVTVAAGGLAFMYNLVIGGARFTSLNLTPKEVCQIFTGAITKWNDPELLATPGDAVLAALSGRAQVITPVVRQDAAGESYVLSQFCISVDPADWNTFKTYVNNNSNSETQAGWNTDAEMAIGQPIEYWPPILSPNATALQANLATGAVDDVINPQTGESGITYVAAVYAKNAGFPVASMENSSGHYIQPDANSVQLALSYATSNALGTFNLNFSGTNPDAYFPSTYSYVIAPTTVTSTTSSGAEQTLAQFLCFAVGQGQNDASRLLYAPLSAEVTQLSVAAIEKVRGAPPASGCGKGGPAPTVLASGGGIKGNNGSNSGGTTLGNGGGAQGGGGSPSNGGAAAGSPAGGSPAGGASNSGGSGGGSSAAGATSSGRAGSTGGAARSSGGVSGQGALGSLSTGIGSSSSPVSVQLAAGDATASGTTNSESYWYLFIGAIVCAVGVSLAGTRRRETA